MKKFDLIQLEPEYLMQDTVKRKLTIERHGLDSEPQLEQSVPLVATWIMVASGWANTDSVNIGLGTRRISINVIKNNAFIRCFIEL